MPLASTVMKFTPQKRKRTGETKVCPQCGTAFYLQPYHVKRGEVYCSKACEIAATPRVDKICPQCGKTFTVNASTADRYTVCSRECRTAETKYVSCERCGKVFRAEKRLNRHYCSEECRRPPHDRQCKTCGKRFHVLPGDTDRQFCCFACYRKHTGETLLERRSREALVALGIEFIQEAKMGRYSVDFLLPTMRIAMEVDGAYWHRDPKRDAAKDRFLSKNGWRVVRIGESELTEKADCVNVVSARLNESSN